MDYELLEFGKKLNCINEPYQFLVCINKQSSYLANRPTANSSVPLCAYLQRLCGLKKSRVDPI